MRLPRSPAGVVIPESLRTMMLVWKNRRMVNTGIATQRVSPRAVAMMSDDIDISEMSNSANRNCRQNISDGWIMVGRSSMPCGDDAPFQQRPGALVVGQRNAELEMRCGHGFAVMDSGGCWLLIRLILRGVRSTRLEGSGGPMLRDARCACSSA